jgi:hypothetical protein
MSGTRLDWISFGLADSLKHMLRQLIWWCNDFARSKGPQPCRAGYSQPDSFSKARVIMSDWSRAKEFVSTDTAIVSCKLLRGILRPASCVTSEPGHSPAKGNSPGLSSSVIEGLWHWLLIWGLLHPRTLVCADRQLQEPSDQGRKSACH